MNLCEGKATWKASQGSSAIVLPSYMAVLYLVQICLFASTRLQQAKTS
jgi:hypothetical protein